MKNAIVVLMLIVGLGLVGCKGSHIEKNSDSVQQDQSEQMLAEATSAVGMPAIKNFRERRILKDIQELCDQTGLVTYTYIENMVPTPTPGKTALGGKFTYLGETVGYGIPFSTQFTNPMKLQRINREDSYDDFIPIPQADPNGLFKPASSDATWVMMKDPGSDRVSPVYIEPKIFVSQFKLPMD